MNSFDDDELRKLNKTLDECLVEMKKFKHVQGAKPTRSPQRMRAWNEPPPSRKGPKHRCARCGKEWIEDAPDGCVKGLEPDPVTKEIVPMALEDVCGVCAAKACIRSLGIAVALFVCGATMFHLLVTL